MRSFTPSPQQLISRTQIPLPCPLDDLIAHRPALSLRATVLQTLPEALRCEPVAKILLVEARLAATRSIPLLRPVARRVGRERLVDEDKLAAVDQPKLELGVCDDEPPRGGVLRRGGVQLYSDIGDLVV